MKGLRWSSTVVILVLVGVGVITGGILFFISGYSISSPSEHSSPSVQEVNPFFPAEDRSVPSVSRVQSSASRVPFFIQKGQTYQINTPGLGGEITVVAILDDGWIQVQTRRDSGWLHVTSGTFFK